MAKLLLTKQNFGSNSWRDELNLVEVNLLYFFASLNLRISNYNCYPSIFTSFNSQVNSQKIINNLTKLTKNKLKQIEYHKNENFFFLLCFLVLQIFKQKKRKIQLHTFMSTVCLSLFFFLADTLKQNFFQICTLSWQKILNIFQPTYNSNINNW